MSFRLFLACLVCTLVLVFPTHAQIPTPEPDPIFPQLQGVNRVLVITGPEGDGLFFEQYDLLESAIDGLDDREVLALHYPGRIIKRLDGLSSYTFRDRLLRKATQRRYLEERLGVDDDVFSVVLVGFDGLTKQVWNDVVDPAEIFAIIDDMPIRKRELDARK